MDKNDYMQRAIDLAREKMLEGHRLLAVRLPHRQGRRGGGRGLQ